MGLFAKSLRDLQSVYEFTNLLQTISTGASLIASAKTAEPVRRRAAAT